MSVSLVVKVFEEGGAILIDKDKVVLCLMGRPPVVLRKSEFFLILKKLVKDRNDLFA